MYVYYFLKISSSSGSTNVDEHTWFSHLEIS